LGLSVRRVEKPAFASLQSNGCQAAR
jgi:hypothetical protein